MVRCSENAKGTKGTDPFAKGTEQNAKGTDPFAKQQQLFIFLLKSLAF